MVRHRGIRLDLGPTTIVSVLPSYDVEQLSFD